MDRKYRLIPALILAVACQSFAQHSHEAKKENEEPLKFASVLSQILSDPELAAYKLESSVMTIVPGGVDTVSHRHDCELFGYVMEGTVEIGLGHATPMPYKTGEMFYERRNVLHSFTKNSSQKTPAKVLLIFIIKNGRKGYTSEYQ